MQLNFQLNLNPFGVRVWRKQPLRILVVRHGQTEANVDQNMNKVYADKAIPLTELGMQQAYDAGEFIAKFYAEHGVRNRVRMWCSPYHRAEQTGDLIMCALIKSSFRINQIDRRFDFNLREQEFGYEDGMSEEEIEKNFPFAHGQYQKQQDQRARFFARKFGGESWADVAARTKNWIGTAQRDAEKHGISDVIVVAHGVTNRALTMMFCHHDHFNPEWFEDERNPKNCSVRLLDGNGPDSDKGYIHPGG